MHITPIIKKIYPEILREKTELLLGRRVYHSEFDKQRCIFIHIPKTAGTSIGKALFSDGKTGHWKVSAYQWTNPKKFQFYFKFAFVRNPWDRLVSAYTYLQEGGKNKSDNKWAEQHIRKYSTFEHFVQEWLSPETAMSWGHFVPQYKFLSDSTGKINIDYLGRFENIDESFKHITKKLNCKASLPKINASNRTEYSRYYNNNLIDKVASIYKKDIELFNYTFEQ